MSAADKTEEWFDVVNEHDQVIERRPRSEVHRLRLRHRAVHIFVRRSDGQLLIHQRTETKEEFPGVWTSSASGHVSAGESYAESAARELTEELGISVPLHRCYGFEACPETSMEFTELFECQWDGEINPDPAEIQDTRWVDLETLASDVDRQPECFSPAFLLLLTWYQNRSG